MAPSTWWSPFARALLVAVVVCATACESRHADPAAHRETPKRILIGATLPIGTTAAGKAARFYQEGYELAVEVANRGGGLKVGARKVPVELKLLGDRNDPETGAKLTEQLLQEERVDFLLGSYSSAVVEAEANVAERHGVPYVTGAGASSEVFRTRRRSLFSVQTSIDLLAYTVMRWIDEQQKARRLPPLVKVGVLTDTSPQGKEFRDGVADFVTKTANRRSSYQLVFQESFAPEQQDFAAMLRRLNGAGADVVLIHGSLADFFTLHRQYLALGLCHKVLSYGAHGGDLDALEAFGVSGVSHLLSAVWWSSRMSRGGLNARFIEAFKENHHRDPEWYAALAYEAARALFTAIEHAGSTDRELVREQLAALRMESIVPGGWLAFGADQRARYPFVVQQNTPNGKSLIVYPNDAAESPGIAANPRCKSDALAASTKDPAGN